MVFANPLRAIPMFQPAFMLRQIQPPVQHPVPPILPRPAGHAGVVRIQVTRDAGLAVPGRMMAPSRFQRWCEYGSRCWRSSEAARE